MTIERWKEIPGYEKLYLISNLGRVRSLTRKSVQNKNGKLHAKIIPGKYISHSINDRGYCIVTLSKRGKTKSHSIHTLMALTFLGPRPEGHQVLHGDDNKQNNELSNLRYGTRKENYQDAVKNKKIKEQKKGEKSSQAKLSNRDAAWIRVNSSRFTKTKLAKMFKVSERTIAAIINRETYSER